MCLLNWNSLKYNVIFNAYSGEWSRQFASSCQLLQLRIFIKKLKAVNYKVFDITPVRWITTLVVMTIFFYCSYTTYDSVPILNIFEMGISSSVMLFTQIAGSVSFLILLCTIFSNKFINIILSLYLMITSTVYLFLKIKFGSISVGTIASIFESNTSEAKEFIFGVGIPFPVILTFVGLTTFMHIHYVYKVGPC